MSDNFKMVDLDAARRERDHPPVHWDGDEPPPWPGETDPEPPPTLELLDPITLQDKPVPVREWLVPGMIPRRNVVLFSGDGGLGKSLLMLQLQVATAVHRNWIGREVHQCRSLGIYCEDEADELHRRMEDIRKFYDVEFGDLENMTVAARVGDDNFLGLVGPTGTIEPTPLYHSVVAACQSTGSQLLILDTVTDMFGGNENVRPEVRSFIGLLRRLAMEINGSVVLTAHPSQAGLASGTGYSGSTAWNNSVRQRFYLTRPDPEEGDNDPDRDERVLKSMKANYGQLDDAIDLTWKAGVFIADESQADTPTVAGIKRGTHEKLFLELLDTLAARGIDVSVQPGAANFAPKAMLDMTERGKTKRIDLQRAMYRLLDDQTIVVEEYGPPSRSRKRLVKTPNGRKPDPTSGGLNL